MKLRIPASAALTAAFVGSVLTASPVHAGSRVDARNDRASVAAGATKTVNVLANDRAPRTARVKVLWSAGVSAQVKRTRKVRIAVPAGTTAGVYKIRYNVTAGRHSDRAVLRVTVPSATPTPEPEPHSQSGTLTALIASLPVAAEQRTGYDRDLFKHWNGGAIYGDGCDTRSEVLKAEAVIPVAADTACPIYSARSGGGSWYSYYDGLTSADPSSFDIDHMVPLAEAWDSGAYGWDAATREAFANDQGDARSLVAVSASANRGKGDQDPAEWLPRLERCRYIGEWVAVKHRWDLTADQTEKDALAYTAGGCENVTIVIIER
ncbi:hypothetical protein DDE18_15785 [Nocardioides gansuensis]|uniref:GmrSD restriction endonucleases C-terminal domain-containing protein n=1 Tax=Nocardioides gansuensis TaxID=2138300 RepID=A0A2T8F8W2_9ACTN|nr:HNH endonuclease family protein [Nocardioides gansuensis]PVG82135.1 hypothetical protein DDE18_15785 [Nocardioides gansuensis]